MSRGARLTGQVNARLKVLTGTRSLAVRTQLCQQTVFKSNARRTKEVHLVYETLNTLTSYPHTHIVYTA